MKGLELSRRYYEECGRPVIESQFSGIADKLAFGMTGSGSECYGYDDGVSEDHDFEPGFIIFLPGEDVIDRKTEFELERAYAKLPKEFEGYRRGNLNPVGGNRHGIIRAADYYTEKTGSPDGTLDMTTWLTMPQYALAESVNGEIFRDDGSLVTSIRERLCAMPEDARKKRLAGNLLLMAQSGQYNYKRCLSHGEEAAAQLAVFEFVKATMECVFLLNKTYMPYYKWSFRAMRDLPSFADIAPTLEYLLTTGNSEGIAEDKYMLIENISGGIAGYLKENEMTKAVCTDLEKHAYSVNDSIEDAQVRNLNILCAV